MDAVLQIHTENHCEGSVGGPWKRVGAPWKRVGAGRAFLPTSIPGLALYLTLDGRAPGPGTRVGENWTITTLIRLLLLL